MRYSGAVHTFGVYSYVDNLIQVSVVKCRFPIRRFSDLERIIVLRKLTRY